MATTASAYLQMKLDASMQPDSPLTGGNDGSIENVSGGRRWTSGTASGQVDRVFRKNYTISSGATQAFDLLAAGSLTDVQGQAIDADELKAVVIKITSGAALFQSPVANGLDCFTDAQAGLQLKASGGLRCVALDFGPDGLSVTTNSKFDLIESTSAASASVEVAFICAQ